MTPEQKRELQEILRSVDGHFQRVSGADVPGQKMAHTALSDADLETWRGALRGLRIVDDAFEGHQRMRGSVETAVTNLEAR